MEHREGCADDPRPDRPAVAPSGSARQLLSRRGFAIGAVAVGVAAAAGVGVPLLASIISATKGLRVTPLFEKPGFIVAHRGGSRDWPEMSMEAYRHSVDVGANALEISLSRSSDGVWFGLHDATLDRTSGTKGFVASEHSWAEIRTYRISAKGTLDTGQPSQPYIRFEDLVDAYANTHTIFVDPKKAERRHHPELIAKMKAAVDDPSQSFIAKGYCMTKAWPVLARAHGLKSWGYYYGSEVEADPQLLSTTQSRWSYLGMNYAASNAAWESALAYAKPVLGHIIADRRAGKFALSRGAAGLIVSGIKEVL